MDYGYIRELNAQLLDKYNNEENKLTFIDCYFFQLTSLALSLFREREMNNKRISISEAFVLRCIIENIAIIRMYDEKDIPEDAVDLLKGYQYICEYKIYKKHPLLEGDTLPLKDMEKNYQDVKDYYREKFGADLRSREFNDIVNSRLPFLMNTYSFHTLIDMYCHDLLHTYEHLSIIVHPVDILTNYCYFGIEAYDNLIDPIFKMIIFEVEKYYTNVVPTFEHEWNYELSYCYGGPGQYSKLVDLHFPQLNCISKFIDYARKDFKVPDDKVCVPEVFFARIYDELESILYDKAFGFSEIIKSKVKPIFELMAVFYYTMKSTPENLELMELFSYINYLKVLDGNIEDKLLKTYSKYKELTNKEIEFEEYKKKITKKSMPEFLGYESINSFVFEMIDELIPNVPGIKDTVKMIYEESQNLSHGNGYMLLSNYGAFMDSFTASQAIDELLYALITKFNDDVQNGDKAKAKYDFAKLKKKYDKLYVDKFLSLKLLSESMVEIK